MKTSLLRSRQVSLTLLVLSALANAHVLANYSSANPIAFGATRLEQDLSRRTTPVTTADPNMFVSVRSRRFRILHNGNGAADDLCLPRTHPLRTANCPAACRPERFGFLPSAAAPSADRRRG
jgi:hypothetical protein